MPGIGAPEIALIVGVIVLLFGARKLPEIARSLGKAKGEFKKGLQEGDSDQTQSEINEDPATKSESAEPDK